MNFVSALTQQFAVFFNSQSAARRFMLLVIIAGSIGGLGWLMVRASSGGYVPILTGSEMSDKAAALNKLSQVGIRAHTDDTGTILVARNDRDKALRTLAAEGIFDRGIVGSELMDRNSFGDSKFKQEKNYLRMREGEMARSLMFLSEVEYARVHLALPEDQLFAKEQETAKASVVLKLRPGARLSERQIGGVVNLVSHGVEGLASENVSIIDSEGNMLNRNQPTDFNNITSENLNYKTQAEERIRREVEKMLERTIGKDRVIASVQMDYDFSSLKSVQTIFNPRDQDPIVQTEKSTTEQQTTMGVSPAISDPSAGTASTSNMPAMPGTIRNDMTKSYALSQEIQETSLTVPTLRRITVGVLVDGEYDEAPAGAGAEEAAAQRTFKPRGDEEMAKLASVVKAIIGFDDQTRTDVVEISCVPFKNEEFTAPEQSFLTEHRNLIELVVQWAVVGIIALLLILLVLKPAIKQITVTPVNNRGMLPGFPMTGSGGGGGALANLPADLRGLSEEELARYAAAQGNSALLQQIQQSNRVTTESSQQIFREIQEEARNNPQKTVSMIRQWMEEG